MNDCILITGCAGFLGSHLTRAIIESGYSAIGIDDLSSGFRENVPDHASLIFYKADLCDALVVDKIFSRHRPTIVIHLAANAREGASFFSPIDITRRNALALVNVIQPAIQYGMKKIIFTSSMARYGDQQPPFDESIPTKSVDCYSSNKVFCEQIIQQLAGAHGFEWTILVPHNIIGQFQSFFEKFI